jgi:NADPH:quinone reductase-like Zn-dependent oxidoreductase
MIEEGTVAPVIDRICSLAAVPAAIADLEAGRICGKVVVSNTTR